MDDNFGAADSWSPWKALLQVGSRQTGNNSLVGRYLICLCMSQSEATAKCYFTKPSVSQNVQPCVGRSNGQALTKTIQKKQIDSQENGPADFVWSDSSAEDFLTIKFEYSDMQPLLDSFIYHPTTWKDRTLSCVTVRFSDFLSAFSALATLAWSFCILRIFLNLFFSSLLMFCFIAFLSGRHMNDHEWRKLWQDTHPPQETKSKRHASKASEKILARFFFKKKKKCQSIFKTIIHQPV